MKIRTQNPLMEETDRVFWGEYDKLEGYPGERYMVIDTRTGEKLVDEAVLVSEKKIKV